MPLVASFQVDHTIMKGPSVRKAKTMKTPHGDTIEIYDLRFKTPNTEMMDGKGVHTLEHYFASYMRDFVTNDTLEVIDISPMGCRTGFYMSLLGDSKEEYIQDCMVRALRQIANLDDDTKIIAANKYQCGSWEYHSIKEAKKIAQEALDKGIAIVYSQDIALSEDKIKELSK